MLGWRAMKRASQTSPLMDLYYPELYAQIACINVPGWWTILLAAFKPFFSQETLDAIQVYRRGEEYALTSQIDVSHVPACYGGSVEQLPQEAMAEMGLDLLGPEEFDALFPGPATHVRRPSQCQSSLVLASHVSGPRSVRCHSSLVPAYTPSKPASCRSS